MNKPEYLHSGSLAAAVLAGSGTSASDFVNGDIHTEPELSDPADDRGSRPWLTVIKSAGVRNARIEQWFSECVLWGHEALQNSVEIDPKRRGGIPVLKGTRFTVGQTLAELADSSGVPEVARQFDLDDDTIRELLYGLALLADRPRP